MPWRLFKLIIIGTTLLMLAASTVGPVIILGNGREGAIQSAQSALERSAQAAENALNRQLLQVHGALASLPILFSVAKASPLQPEISSRLLQGLNFQTLAYRNLLLLRPDGSVLASARYRATRRPLAIDLTELSQAPTALVGPVRNALTGEWTLYVARTVPEWNGIIAVAEVPLLTLMDLIAETRIQPGAILRLEKPDGQLIAALPHDEIATGQIDRSTLTLAQANGQAFIDSAPDGSERLAVVRPSLYSDIRVVLTERTEDVLAGWRTDRDRMILASIIRVVLIGASGAALFFAVRQRQQIDAERARSAAVLTSAIDAMSDGFAMWDEQDRLVTCNERYRELYALSGAFIIAGTPYEEMLRKGVEIGQHPQAKGDEEAFIQQTLALHREATGSFERLLPNGRWLLIQDRPMPDGGIVGIRTDITSLKQTLAELAEANARANEAAHEARRQNEALSERESRIRFLAHHDDLTGLPNRALFHEQLSNALAGACGEAMALLYLDLDRFKEVNDTLGHQVGDALLEAVAGRLRSCVDDQETVARLGGDEFAIIKLELASPHEAQALGARVIASLSEPYSILGHTIATSVSIGIALGEQSVTDPNTVLQRADLALYEAKARGRSIACVFVPEMEARLRDRLQMEAELRLALAEEQFTLAYQPIYNLKTGALCGFEALLRWQHPRMGMVSPGIFIPVAEETRLIVDLGAWVLRRACLDVAGLPGDLKVAINLSPVQLAVGDIVATVADVLRESGLQPARVELEITETALFTDDQRNMDALRRLKSLGVRIVLDDFGTGFSSLSHLRAFPLDKIKIDRSFIQDMADHPDSAAIVEAVASLAHRLGMATTAEGIETPEQLAIVGRVGCTEAQGFLLGRPKPITEVFAISPPRLALEASFDGGRGIG